MSINIAKIEVVSLVETIDITIDFEGELYRYQATVFVTEKYSCLSALSYLNHYKMKLKTTQKRKIRNYLNQYFKEEGKL